MSNVHIIGKVFSLSICVLYLTWSQTSFGQEVRCNIGIMFDPPTRYLRPNEILGLNPSHKYKFLRLAILRNAELIKYSREHINEIQMAISNDQVYSNMFLRRLLEQMDESTAFIETNNAGNIKVDNFYFKVSNDMMSNLLLSQVYQKCNMMKSFNNTIIAAKDMEHISRYKHLYYALLRELSELIESNEDNASLDNINPCYLAATALAYTQRERTEISTAWTLQEIYHACRNVNGIDIDAKALFASIYEMCCKIYNDGSIYDKIYVCEILFDLKKRMVLTSAMEDRLDLLLLDFGAKINNAFYINKFIEKLNINYITTTNKNFEWLLSMLVQHEHIVNVIKPLSRD